MKKIVICGGHLTPALALLEELAKRRNLKIFFFGRKFATEGSSNLSVEYHSISACNIPFISLTTGRWQRKFTQYTLTSLAKIPIGFAQSLFYLLKIRPNLIVSFGGYLSVPVVFAGWLLGIEIVCHEQSIVPGLATKINSLFAKKVFLTWSQSQHYFGTKGEVIGNLTRKAIFQKITRNQKIQDFLDKKGKLIFITGGNQGSHFLNTKIASLLPKLKNYLIFHQVGTANFQGDQDNAKQVKRENYFVVTWLDSSDFGAVTNRADLLISRSGANTVWDLAILAKIAILVPLPIAAGHEQETNAQILQKAGSALIIRQDELTPAKLLDAISQMFVRINQHQKAARNLQKILPRDATAKFTTYCLSFLK